MTTKETKFAAGLLSMAEEHQKRMDGMSTNESLAFVKTIFDRSDVVFGVWHGIGQDCGTVVLKGDAPFREAIASDKAGRLTISAVPCSHEHAIAVRQRFDTDEGQKKNDAKWNALLRYDDEVRAAAERLHSFGDCWVNELAKAYFALNEDRKYLSNIVSRLADEAEQSLPNMISRVVTTCPWRTLHRGRTECPS